MPKSNSDKRVRLIDAAAELAYRRGFGETALADIARRAQVPLGNVYYYFKTKEEIGEAIIERRLAEFQSLREAWDKLESPKRRLQALVELTLGNRGNLARSGCPIGSFCSELQKGEGPLARNAARPFAEAQKWVEAQFAALGTGRQKKALALHLLAALQGVSLLAHSFGDPELVVLEATHLKRWIDEL
ncbi:MAG TPA: TetR/AcrR family transcriptional regulator [Steroidobacteraceae bacterium]|jgi:AcrR family transcriptional regulator